MLKTQSTHHLQLALGPSRLTTLPSIVSARRLPPDRHAMTTDATVSKGGQQPMLASQRAKEQKQQQSQSGDQPRSGGRMTYFPLGYKEAAQQWVSVFNPACLSSLRTLWV